MAKKARATNGVFKTIVREVVREELKGTEGRLGKRFDKKFQATEERLELKLQATEERLELKLQATEERLELKLQATEERLDEKIDSSFRKYKDEVLTGLDKVMGELQTIREESTIHQGQHDSIEERLEKLDQPRS